MKIKVLGTRGEVKPSLSYHSRHSGLLVNDSLLFDLGEEEYLKYQPRAVFITHFHPDHAFFIVERAPDIEVPIYGPEEYRNNIKITVISGEVEMRGCRIIPVPTHHSKKVKSTAYLITDGMRRLLYTGDLVWINREHHQLIEDLDLVITDGSFFRKGGMIRKDRETGQIYGHNGIPELVRLFSRFTRRIMFVHFGSWFYEGAKQSRRKLAELGKQSGITIYTGYDGMEMDLDRLD
ncbi:MAG: MBL fold metallo-hydrolase [Candidatus Aminicenantes bacterium]